MKYILRKFLCDSNLQTAVFIYGVLASIFSGVLLITTLSTDVFKDTRYIYNVNSRYYETTVVGNTPLFWAMVIASIVHMISSIFLAIGVEKKNVWMMVPWLVAQAITFVPLIPIIVGVLLCFSVVSFPVYLWWAAFSIFMALRAEEAQVTGRIHTYFAGQPSSPTAPHSNDFEDIQLPAYMDVVPDGAKKYNK